MTQREANNRTIHSITGPRSNDEKGFPNRIETQEAGPGSTRPQLAVDLRIYREIS